MKYLPLGLVSLILHSLVRPVWANSGLIYVTTSLENFDARIVQANSDGGGGRWTIGTDSSHPFAGRDFGGADRDGLKGSAFFGSGYPYGDSNKSSISGRPFPYGLWPLYWANDTMGSSEYGPALNSLRPGGELVAIPLRTQAQYYNVTEDEVYYIIGDRDSSLFMMISLVASCHVTPAWPSKFIPMSSNSTIKIENVIQYYRASSFALAYRAYNNTSALGRFSTDSEESTPLTGVVSYSKFMHCLDGTITNALPIMNSDWHPPSPAVTAIIDIISYGPMTFIALVIVFVLSRSFAYWMERRILTLIRGDLEAIAARKAALDARLETLAYENYP